MAASANWPSKTLNVLNLNVGVKAAETEPKHIS